MRHEMNILIIITGSFSYQFVSAFSGRFQRDTSLLGIVTESKIVVVSQ